MCVWREREREGERKRERDSTHLTAVLSIGDSPLSLLL